MDQHQAQHHSLPKDLLIVDDTPENLRVLSALLLKEGYGVRQAINGQMALATVAASPPDLILLDIMMPDLDGYEVCKALKSDQQLAKIPVIFLSASNEGFNKAKAFAVGGADYVSKPFQIEEILARIRNQLSLRAAEKENELLNAQLEERVKERTHQLELAQAQLLKMALHDALTGLPNRPQFMERLQQAMQWALQSNEHQFAVLFLDCDRFKVINDSLGHLVGDELLIAIAHRLQALLPAETVLARLGGDEFTILLTGSRISDRATQLAEKILLALSHSFQLSNREVYISASIGIAIGNSHYEKPEHLLRDADTAMYHAKEEGKACYRVFDAAMHEAAMQRLYLESDLRKAMQNQELTVYYQPIVALGTGRITGFEALVRWQHPHLGLVSPTTFIAIAEETGLIIEIDRWMIRQACEQLAQWKSAFSLETELSISVNISAKHFAEPNLVDYINRVLEETQTSPHCLKLEITESAIIDNPEVAAITLQHFQASQIQVSIDDFGTGYSSLSYLHSFPVDTLKIDRSFVQRINDSRDSLGLILLIINIARTMQMTVVAEGIETAQQLDQLKLLNCDFGQGYLFSQPLEPDKAVELLSSNLQW